MIAFATALRRIAVGGLGLIAGLCVAGAPAVAGAPDCPLATEPYSLESPLIDVLLSPAARAALEQAAPGMLKAVPARFQSADPPSMAAILTVRMMAGFTGVDAPAQARLGTALAATPVSAADQTARCARYDETPLAAPSAPAARSGAPRLLIFEKVNGFRDGPSLEAARAAILEIARRRGWAVEVTDRGGAMSPRTLARFDAVVWNNVSGDVLTLKQRAAFQHYVEAGGGFVGVHGSGGDAVYFWPWYVDVLLGARFEGHPDAPQFQAASVEVEPYSALTAGLPERWTMTDEWYSFSTNPRASGSRIVATLDEASYSPVGHGRSLATGDHPIAWARCVGRGRSFYSAIGHRPETWSDAHHLALVEQGLDWAMSGRTDGCRLE